MEGLGSLMGMVFPPTSRQQWPLRQTYRFSQALLLLWVTPGKDNDIIEANFESNAGSNSGVSSPCYPLCFDGLVLAKVTPLSPASVFSAGKSAPTSVAGNVPRSVNTRRARSHAPVTVGRGRTFPGLRGFLGFGELSLETR